jgi:hypothetical protein
MSGGLQRRLDLIVTRTTKRHAAPGLPRVVHRYNAGVRCLQLNHITHDRDRMDALRAHYADSEHGR